MSISMSKGDGVTVFTVTSDPKSSVPPICQILRSLCYSPVCCSVSERLRRLQGAALSALGALQILIGLLHIGLGTILIVTPGWWYRIISYTGVPYWIGALSILFGIFSILSQKFPSPCLAIITLILNLCGIAFAITGIVLYSINMADVGMWWLCDNDYYDDRRWPHPSPTPPSRMKRNCLEAKSMVLMALRGIDALLIILSALQLCLSISASALGIRALKKRGNVEEKANEDPEVHNPLLESGEEASA